MKKLIALLLAVMSMLCLASCNGGNNNPPADPDDNKPGDQQQTEMVSDYIALVRPNDSLDLSQVVNAIFANNNRTLPVLNDSNVAIRGEIVFGESERSVTEEAKAAYEALVAAESGKPESYGGYIIYKDAIGNIAVYWSDRYTQKLAMNTVLDQYANIDTLLAYRPGRVFAEVINLDDYIYNITWGKLEAQAPADVVDALKSLATMYDGSAIADWMANLWEPYICVCGKCEAEGKEIACYGGAFYYANSGRDYEGFLPDLESTRQLLSWMVSNGAFELYSNFVEPLPQEIIDKIVQFCQACLDPDDGYFYHPQWGKAIGTARKGRDLSWGIALLEAFGVKPQYPTAEDRLAGKASANLTAPLANSGVSAVSAIVSVDAFDEAVKSPEKFLAWLKDVTNGDNMFSSSTGAHTINAVQNQIIAAGYTNILLDYLDEQQEKLFNEMKAKYDADPVNNPEPTGLWQRTIDYNAVWGLLKLAPFYTAGNREIKYAEYAMKTCVGCIMIDADEGGNYHANDLMNQWSSANMLISNVKKHNPTLVEKLYEIARENAPAMIAESKAKIAKFIQADGTFGYNQGTSAPTTQGTPVSMGLPEGDVNATSLICTMYRCCFTVLGYSVVPLCDYRDGERFIETITNLGSAAGSKIPQAKGEPIGFEDESKPVGMNESFNNGRTEIVDDPLGQKGKVLYFDTSAHGSAGDTITFSHNNKNANCYVLEFDINVADFRGANAAGTIFQIRLGESFMLEVYHDNGKISLRANPTTKNSSYAEPLNITFDLNQWASIRIEYYVDSVNPTTKVFYNDTLTATTHSFFIGDASSPAGMTPKNLYTQARFFALRAVDATVYFDNFFIDSTLDTYNDSTTPFDKK